MRNLSEQNTSLLDDNEIITNTPTAVEGIANPKSDDLQNFAVLYFPESHRLILYIDARADGHHLLSRFIQKRYPDEKIEIKGGGGVEFNSATKKLIVYSASTTLGTVESKIIRRFLEELEEVFNAQEVRLEEPPARKQAQAA